MCDQKKIRMRYLKRFLNTTSVLLECVGWNYDNRIEPVFLPGSVLAVCRNFLEETISNFLEDVPLTTRNAPWFIHADAPPHFSLAALFFLTAIFRDVACSKPE